MEHLISAITLAKDYGSPPIDLTNFSNLTNWSSTATILSQASNSFIVRLNASESLPTDPIHKYVRSGAFSPKIDVSYGANFQINFDLNVDLISGGPTNNFRLHISLRDSANFS